MPARTVRSSVCCIATCVGLASLAHAQAEGAPSAVLWYRSSEECPDGAEFLAKVGERASLVRLAEAGDRVDFVVNLGVTATGARGRLERETGSGTVAIREVEDASCERVADVLALNLSLALEPQPAVASPGEPPEAETSEPASEAPPARSDLEPHEPAPRVDRAATDTKTDAPPPAGGAEPKARRRIAQERSSRRFGVQAGAVSGLSPEPHWRGSLFLDIEASLAGGLSGPSFRAGVSGTLGSAGTDSGTVRQSLWAGRLELCPLSIGGTLSLKACASGEVGRLSASRTEAASSLWAALGAHARASWISTGLLGLEAELGASLPLKAYEVAAGSTVLYRSSTVGFSGLIGASVGF